MFDYKKTWKFIASTRKAESYHIVQYIVLKAVERAEGDTDKAINLALAGLSKAFTPIRNQKRLDNGHSPLLALYKAIDTARRSKDVLWAPKEVLSVQDKLKLDSVLFLLHDSEFLKEYFYRRYVYIFVRQDISPEYQLVQASHVAMKIGFQTALDNSLSRPVDPNETYFAVIGAEDKSALARIREHLKRRDITYSVFIEPDMGNQITAVATYPIPVNERGDLLNYKRLKFS